MHFKKCHINVNISHFDVSVSFIAIALRVIVRYHLWLNEWKHYHFRFSSINNLDLFFFSAHKLRIYCKNVTPKKVNILIWLNCGAQVNDDAIKIAQTTLLISFINLINFSNQKGNTSIKINVYLMLKWVLKLFQMILYALKYNHTYVLCSARPILELMWNCTFLAQFKSMY